MPGGGADGRPFADTIGWGGLTCCTGAGSGEPACSRAAALSGAPS